MMDEETLFSKIISGQIPADKVYEDDEFCAFRDIHPAAPSHVLLVPRKIIAKLTDANDADEGLLGRMLLTANKVAEKLGIANEGFRLVINCGAHGGQEVPHLHFHILGGRPLGWPPG